MSLIVNGTEIDKVVYNGTEIDKLIYNGTVVWESSDELIMNVSSVEKDYGSEYGVWVYVSSGPKGCSVSFNNETQNISPDTSSSVKFETVSADISGDLIIKGDFTSVEPSNIGDTEGAQGYKINEIKKWYKKLNYVPNYFFQYMIIDFDIELPDNIVEIEENAFRQDANADIIISSNNILTFNNLESCNTFEPRDTFFSNATNNGDVWSINGFVLAPYGSNAMGRTDTFTIPNGTKYLATDLFHRYPSTGFVMFALSNIIFPTDGLLTEIPNGFCTDAVNLNNLEIPASITKIGAKAFGQEAQNMTLSNITFKHSENAIIEFSDDDPFYTKSTIETNIYTDNNLIILNREWERISNRIVTFYKLDKITIIPRLLTPVISINGTILNIDDYDPNSSEFVVSALGAHIITTTNTTIDLSQYLTEPNVSYSIEVSSSTNNNTYARSLPAEITYQIQTT